MKVICLTFSHFFLLCTYILTLPLRKLSLMGYHWKTSEKWALCKNPKRSSCIGSHSVILVVQYGSQKNLLPWFCRGSHRRLRYMGLRKEHSYFAIRGKGAAFRKLCIVSLSFVWMTMCHFRDSEELGRKESDPVLSSKEAFLWMMLLV